MKKINGDLVIEKGDSEDYSQLTEVSGSVYVRQGATFTAPALTEVSGSVDVQEGATFTAPLLAEAYFKIGYKNLYEYHHTGKFPTGIYLPLNKKEIEYLTMLKPIIEANRLNMAHWHQNDNWKNQSIAQVHECKTTHCVAGWIQIFEKDKYNNISAQEAGIKCAPNLAWVFDKTNEQAELVVKTLLG